MMKILLNAAIASAIAIFGAAAAQAATLSNVKVGAVEPGSNGQLNVSLVDQVVNREFSNPNTQPADNNYSNYQLGEAQYPQNLTESSASNLSNGVLTLSPGEELVISNSLIGVVKPGISGQVTINNSAVGAVQSETTGELNTNNSMIGAVQSQASGEVNTTNSTIGAVQSGPNAQVNTSTDENSTIGAIESTSSDAQGAPSQAPQGNLSGFFSSIAGSDSGSSGAQAPSGDLSEFFGAMTSSEGEQSPFPANSQAPQGNLSEFFGSVTDNQAGGNYPAPNYPTAEDYDFEGAFTNQGPQGVNTAKPVPEPSSVLGTLAVGTLAAGVLLKRKGKKRAINFDDKTA